MYRIEVSTGEETVFRTVEELATGIRNGLITPRSRIYHAASQKWLPIEFHPHYKKAVDLVTGGAPMIDTGLTRPPSASARRGVTPPPAKPIGSRHAEPAAAAAPVIPAPVIPAPVIPAPVIPAPRAAVVEPPRPVAPRSEALRFGPPTFAPPRPAPPRYEPPRYEPPRFEQPETEPVAVAAPAIELPGVDIPLPKISYPEVEPAYAEPPHPVARRRARGSASRLIGGVVLLAAVGGYLATRSARGNDAAASPAPAEAAPLPDEQEGDALEAPRPAPVDSAVEAPVVAAPRRSPAAAASATFEPAPKPAGPVSQAWSSSAGAILPTPAPALPPPAAPADLVAELAPPPGELDLSLPKLPSADTIGARARAARDSVALKRILRAVTGRPTDGKTAR